MKTSPAFKKPLCLLATALLAVPFLSSCGSGSGSGSMGKDRRNKMLIKRARPEDAPPPRRQAGEDLPGFHFQVRAGQRAEEQEDPSRQDGGSQEDRARRPPPARSSRDASAPARCSPPTPPGRDPIVTRILWLSGKERHNRNTFGRYIYIHGTPEERKIGRPASYGCIRMKSRDVIDLYRKVGVGAEVEVTTKPLRSTEEGRKHYARY